MEKEKFKPSDTHVDVQYLKLLDHIMKNGADKSDRTGTGTRSVFGYQMRFNLEEGFPLLTTKKVHLRSIIIELIWFLKGETNIKFLQDNNVSIWNEWADEKGELGPVYGSQWRKWPAYKNANMGDQYGAISSKEFFEKDSPIDQITNLIEGIKRNPDGRRHIVSAWNVAEIDKMKLPPCHCLFQFYVVNGKLSCQLYQRSCDVFLGLPFNIASYGLFAMMVAQVTGLKPGEFIWTGGDTHIYNNHFEQVGIQTERRNDIRPMPKMRINPEVKDIFDFKFEDFTLENYDPHPSIKAPISV